MLMSYHTNFPCLENEEDLCDDVTDYLRTMSTESSHGLETYMG